MNAQSAPRACEHCGEPLASSRSDARYCGARCRGRAKYRRDVGERSTAAPALRIMAELPAVSAAEAATSIESSVRETLTAAGVVDSDDAVQALAAARRLDRAANETGASYAALGRFLNERKAAALTAAKLAQPDPLSRMRAARLARGGP